MILYGHQCLQRCDGNLTLNLMNFKSSPTLDHRQKTNCVTLRSCVNEAPLEYILCGCLYFVHLMTDNMACLIFQKMCVQIL